jgi:lysozyme
VTLVDFVKAREGCSLTAYWDAAGSVWTIGYGDTGPEVYEGVVWTQAQCDVSLVSKLTRARQELLALTPPAIIWPPGAQDALTDFVYNEGSGNYEGSTVRKCVEAEDWDGVRRHLLDWEFAGGKRLGGLITRREGEAAMIDTGPPSAIQ